MKMGIRSTRRCMSLCRKKADWRELSSSILITEPRDRAARIAARRHKRRVAKQFRVVPPSNIKRNPIPGTNANRRHLRSKGPVSAPAGKPATTGGVASSFVDVLTAHDSDTATEKAFQKSELSAEEEAKREEQALREILDEARRAVEKETARLGASGELDLDGAKDQAVAERAADDASKQQGLQAQIARDMLSVDADAENARLLQQHNTNTLQQQNTNTESTAADAINQLKSHVTALESRITEDESQINRLTAIAAAHRV